MEHSQEVIDKWKKEFETLDPQHYSYFDIEDMLRNPTMAKIAIEDAREDVTYTLERLLFSGHIKEWPSQEDLEHEIRMRSHMFRRYYGWGRERELG